jgi:hypothetical protein
LTPPWGSFPGATTFSNLAKDVKAAHIGGTGMPNIAGRRLAMRQHADGQRVDDRRSLNGCVATAVRGRLAVRERALAN